MNHASVAHKITVFKEQNQQNMNFTQKHNSMNIYSKSMWFLLLLFRYKFRNVRLHLGKSHSHIIFATKSVPFISFVDECFYVFRQKWYCWKVLEFLTSAKAWDWLNEPWCSIEPRLRTTHLAQHLLCQLWSSGCNDRLIKGCHYKTNLKPESTE